MDPTIPHGHSEAAEFEFFLRHDDHQKRLFGYILSLVRNLDDAEDLFQQTVVVLWEKFSTYDRQRDFFAWACGVARFTISNFFRVRKRSRLYFTDDLNALLAEATVSLGNDSFQARKEALHGCIQKLRERDRELLLSCYSKTRAVAEAAQTSGRSIQSIHNSLCRIRNALFECTRRTLCRDAQPEVNL